MELKLCESDFKFMSVIWDNEPIASGELVRVCNDKLGWKKSTTYTMLKKLCEKGFTVNDNSVITSLVPKEKVQAFTSEHIVESSFGGSLPSFITSFFGGKKISEEEANELKNLIDNFKE